jgi:hypothetical protein
MHTPDRRWLPPPTHVRLTSEVGQARVDKMQQASMAAGSSLASRALLAILLLAALVLIAVLAGYV